MQWRVRAANAQGRPVQIEAPRRHQLKAGSVAGPAVTVDIVWVGRLGVAGCVAVACFGLSVCSVWDVGELGVVVLVGGAVLGVVGLVLVALGSYLAIV